MILPLQTDFFNSNVTFGLKEVWTESSWSGKGESNGAWMRSLTKCWLLIDRTVEWHDIYCLLTVIYIPSLLHLPYLHVTVINRWNIKGTCWQVELWVLEVLMGARMEDIQHPAAEEAVDVQLHVSLCCEFWPVLYTYNMTACFYHWLWGKCIIMTITTELRAPDCQK